MHRRSSYLYDKNSYIPGNTVFILRRGPGTHSHMHTAPISMTHYDDVIMSAITSLISSPTIVYSTIYSDADQRKHQRSASLAFVREIHRWLVNSPHKWPVTRKMFPFDDVIMQCASRLQTHHFPSSHYQCLHNHKAILYSQVPDIKDEVNHL